MTRAVVVVLALLAAAFADAPPAAAARRRWRGGTSGVDRSRPARGYDRAVFEFANALPGYRISYVRPPFHEDGSRKPIAVDGSPFVSVRMEPASGYDLVNDRLVYHGPRRIAGAAHGTSIVRAAVRTGDFRSCVSP